MNKNRVNGKRKWSPDEEAVLMLDLEDFIAKCRDEGFTEEELDDYDIVAIMTAVNRRLHGLPAEYCEYSPPLMVLSGGAKPT